MTCRVVMPLVNYWVNHDSYAERCENKAKPELECDGNCQMEKEIAEAAQDDNSPQSQTTPQSQRTNTNETPELFHLLTDAPKFASPETGTASFLAFVNTALLFGVGTVPFQPPRG
ncbi:MAG: hypothetical protein MUF71_11480 [Candidatus Kapabacteria bacterium]|jgi:hypothetical protein|nr:hypothetical protein [Candidatus Kapabacteria bacterium]